MQQPKNITKNFKFRNIKIGNDRRVMAAHAVQDHQPHFPKAVGYEDIDQAVVDWVDKDLEISYSGVKIPTYKLFSTQRIAEYAQNWQNVDEKGNLNLNFKTVTREPNPQHGELTGNNYNIPGNRDYLLFKTYEKEEKGDEVVQLYSMKQPFAVNLVYTINIVTSSLKVLNEMNTKVLNEFKSLEKYIFPNNHAMPMELNSVGDESDYTIDERKYYAQSYQVKVMAYIIKKEDFKVTKARSRLRNQFVVGQNSGNKKTKEKYDIGTFEKTGNKVEMFPIDVACENEVVPVKLQTKETENVDEEIYTDTNVTSEETEGLQYCWEGTECEITVQRKITYNIPFNNNISSQTFTIEENLELETLSLTNINAYILQINGNNIQIEDSDVGFHKGDEVTAIIQAKNNENESRMLLICYDPLTLEGESIEHKIDS